MAVGLMGVTSRGVRATAMMRYTTMRLARMSSKAADSHHAKAGATENETETVDIHDCLTTPMRGALGERRPRSKLRVGAGGCFRTG